MKTETPTTNQSAQHYRNALQNDFINLFTEKKISIPDAYYLENKLYNMAEQFSNSDLEFLIYRIKKIKTL